MWVWWRSPGWLSGGVSGVLGGVGWRLAGAVPAAGRLGWLAGSVAGLLSEWADRRRCWARSAAQRQGPQPSERTGEFDGPRPGGLQPQDQAAGVTDGPGGDVQEPVAQRLGLGD